MQPAAVFMIPNPDLDLSNFILSVTVLGAIFILRKGKGVGGWYSYILTIPYRGRWVVLDHPYVRKKVA